MPTDMSDRDVEDPESERCRVSGEAPGEAPGDGEGEGVMEVEGECESADECGSLGEWEGEEFLEDSGDAEAETDAEVARSHQTKL